ncbi:MOXD1 like protein 1 [Lucilia cuprina]|nr:MOXD1 like protein 1 [Lucilia cuprina]
MKVFSLISHTNAWPHENNGLHHTETDNNKHNDSLESIAPTSPSNGVHHSDWHRFETMDANGLYLLEWWTKAKDIYFRVTVNTQGFIGLGFSRKSGRMAGADMVLLWVDDRSGKPNALIVFL